MNALRWRLRRRFTLAKVIVYAGGWLVLIGAGILRRRWRCLRVWLTVILCGNAWVLTWPALAIRNRERLVRLHVAQIEKRIVDDPNVRFWFDPVGCEYDTAGFSGIDREIPELPELLRKPRLICSPVSISIVNWKWDDLSVIKGLPLEYLDLDNTRVADLSPLRGMPLKRLKLNDTRVTDLRPLGGMPLETLHLWNTNIADLSALRGVSLRRLFLTGTFVTDLAPLQGMRLELLDLCRSGVVDLAPLAGMPLKHLWLVDTDVADLAPLAGMPLEELYLAGTAVEDLSPLAGMPLRFLNIRDTPAATKPLPAWLLAMKKKGCRIYR